MILSDQGDTLTEVYISGGEVLLGTLRWEKEEEVRAERAQKEDHLKRRVKDLALAETEAQARIQAIHREIEALRNEADVLKIEQQTLTGYWEDADDNLRRLRQGNQPASQAKKDTPNPDPPPADQGGL